MTGHFESVGGVITLESDDQLPLVSASVDVGSIDTGISMRDAHLRTAHFFDLEEHPAVHFRSERVTRVANHTGGEAFDVEGTLTINGISRQVALSARPQPPEFNDNDGTVRLSGEGVIDRRDFGINPPLPMRLTVGRNATLRLVIVARRSDEE
ncbi:MAG: YceI family protein [Actinomycetota bacterium]